MEHIKIAGLPHEASRIALGTWAIGGWMWGGSDEAESVKTIHQALDSGINVIDTAPVYGFGQSEEIVGKALAGGRRRQAVIATKTGLDWSSGKILRDSSPQKLRQKLEDSLRRLQTDVIDIYQVHWPDESVPFEETARTLDDFRREGKIRAIGVSNFSPSQMDRFRSGASLQTVQPPYNLFEREIEKDVLPYAAKHGLTVLAYGALCRGLLAGKITEATEFKGDDLRKSDPKFKPPRLSQYLAAVAKLDKLARERFDKPVLALAVRWILDRGKTIALWGARRPDQLAPVDDAMGWKIDAATMREIDAILAETIKHNVGPEFMAPPPAKAVESLGKRRAG
ncbi:MAG TPA: general stress protein [Rhizobiales bacterium]|jgi:aryl-alcohol dehydrogenase-like predicted oxidoreductase|nr:general stress protein [Hyphomicrobiales bacterium]HAN64000.1 general stress protein [Hyphomicrobiales bacterium]HBH41635.1 general stress protein [Hyphomicrobiales bacterium]HBR26326.1 general stress protein [Hyphomicrobiales bacterium]HCL63101.1 general stress protein [Hyphomicrobiales bacterium]